MKLTLLASIVLPLCAVPALAQSKQVAIPTGYKLETTEGFDQVAKGWGGAAYTLYFGVYGSQHHQMVTNDLTGKGTKILSGLSVRHDYKSYSTSNGAGRKWTSVSIWMNETDYSKFSSTFSTNLGTATNVFKPASVSWPAMSGRPKTKPAPWGVSGLSFSFSSLFVYSGKKALIQDFRFAGGALANGAAWGTSRRGYDLDGLFETLSFSQGTGGPGVRTCADSAFTAGGSIYAQDNSYLAVYSKVYPGSRANSVEWNTSSRYTAKGKPVVHAISVGAPINAKIGAKCNNLFVDFTKPYVIFANTAGTDTRATTPRKTIRLPRTFVTLGTRVVAQTAWTDSKTAQLGLTTAKDHTLRNSIWLTDNPPAWLVAHSTSLTSKTGSLIPLGQPFYKPITLYTYK